MCQVCNKMITKIEHLTGIRFLRLQKTNGTSVFLHSQQKKINFIFMYNLKKIFKVISPRETLHITMFMEDMWNVYAKI